MYRYLHNIAVNVNYSPLVFAVVSSFVKLYNELIGSLALTASFIYTVIQIKNKIQEYKKQKQNEKNHQ